MVNVQIREELRGVVGWFGFFGVCYEGLGKELQCELRICYLCALILKG